ncbi:MAG: hypothetical protein IJD36_01045, partial [Clostridia bacterium]|nr:hypothetical protein [Clostridia bacterium]
VSSDDEQMVLCSVDLVGVSYQLTDYIKNMIKDEAEKVGLDVDKIVMSAIHTHTGPSYTGRGGRRAVANIKNFNGFGSKGTLASMLPEGRKYIEKVNISDNENITSLDESLAEISTKMIKAILDAWNSRKEGGFTNAFGRAVVGLCRRATYNDGSAQMWGDTNRAVFESLEAGSDSGIELLYVFDDNKKLTGIVVNLACPAQCVQHRLFISPDFWGETKKLLREHFGEDLFMLPLCSAAGDQCPVDLIRWVEPESDVNDPNIDRMYPLKRKADPSMFDLAGMKKTGRRIANEIIDVYNDGLDEILTDVEFKHNVHIMKLPLRRVTLEQEKEAKKAIRDYLSIENTGDVDYNDAAKLQVHLGILSRMELQDFLEVVETEVHIMRLGPIAIATNPFELFLDYGNKIKARSTAEQTFLIQLANGTEGYLPTKKAEEGGHYSAFVGSGTVGHEGGEQLVKETLTDIYKLFAE